MTTIQRLLGGMLLSLVATGCSSAIVTPTPDAGPTPVKDAGPGPTESYVLDFTGGEAKGVFLGIGINLAFAIDLTQPVRKWVRLFDRRNVI